MHFKTDVRNILNFTEKKQQNDFKEKFKLKYAHNYY